MLSLNLMATLGMTGVPLASEIAQSVVHDPLARLTKRYSALARRGRERLVGPALAFVKTFYFLRKPEQTRGRLVLQICDHGDRRMPGTTTIYDPPTEGLPYLVVTFTPDGLKITAAKSSLAARTIASERVIRRRSERQGEQSKAINGSSAA